MPQTSRLVSRWGPLVGAVAFYVLYTLVAAFAFDVSLAPRAWPLDLAVQVAFGYWVWAALGRPVVALSVQGLVMGILHLGNAVKLSILGGPIMPNDAFAVSDMLLILDGWRWWAVVLPVAVLVALVVWHMQWRRRRFWRASFIAAATATGFVAQPALVVGALDQINGHVEWDQVSNYTSRGPAMYWVHEGARFLADHTLAPKNDVVAQAVVDLPGRFIEVATATPFVPRNVHMIVMESFWDPSALEQAGFDGDPLHPDFRALWSQAEYNRILSPVFGGYTANAEFEALCGFPVSENAVVFERGLVNSVPCLPAILSSLGYATWASHPNVAAFWNRVNAYRRVGFDRYWSQGDFVLDDVSGHMLSDRSLFRQTRERLARHAVPDQPVFNYVLTFAGHLPFTLNEERPAVIHAQTTEEDVAQYANVTYYSSREVMEHVAALRAADPDAIIVLFGDHLPYLGTQRGPYRESGLLADEQSDYDADHFRNLLGTPAIVIDGQNGVVPIGTLPLYQLPQVILRLLGVTAPRIMDYTEPPPAMQIRPLPGMQVVFGEDGAREVCRAQDPLPLCVQARSWMNNVDTIATDLFQGDQHALPFEPPPSAPVAL